LGLSKISEKLAEIRSKLQRGTYIYLKFDFNLTFDTVSYFTVRIKIRLKIIDQRLSFNGNIKRPNYLFIEMREKRFVFSNKVKAKK
jgi:hypothetical protein